MLQKQRKNEQLGVQSLEAQLLGDSEPERIAASYELAAMAHSEPLALSALQNSLVGTAGGQVSIPGKPQQGDAEDNKAQMARALRDGHVELGKAARRAATYGLISLGPQLASSAFLAAAHSSSSDVRAYGAHGLGEAGDLNDAKVVAAVEGESLSEKLFKSFD